MTPIAVLEIKAVSYVGTTWLNLMLGSHPEAFSIGNVEYTQRILSEAPEKTCMIHGAECDFWPQFVLNWNPGENFFQQVANHCGCRVLIVANVRNRDNQAFLREEEVVHRQVLLIRDARASCASYMRKNPGKDAIDTIREWLFKASRAYEAQFQDPEILTIRYEDLSKAPLRYLNSIGRSLGLRYTPAELCYWKKHHHLSSGNGATALTVRYAHGLVGDKRLNPFYREYVKQIEEVGYHPFKDNRWQDELNSKDLFFIDLFCGTVNQGRGYARNVFTPDEISAYYKLGEEAIERDRFNSEMREHFLEFDPVASRQLDSSRFAEKRRALQEEILLRPVFELDSSKHAKKDDEIKSLCKRKHIRHYPYPFTSALAICSDIDRSNRERYTEYHTLLVKQHGLDFGDSCWLESLGVGEYFGLAFFSRQLSRFDAENGARHRRTHSLTFIEMLCEHHMGHIDIWHSYLPRGPRVVVLSPYEESDHQSKNAACYSLPSSSPPDNSGLYNIGTSPLTAVTIWVQRKYSDRIQGVCLIDKKGNEFVFSHVNDSGLYSAEIIGEKGCVPSLWTYFIDVEKDELLPRMAEMEKLVVVFSSINEALENPIASVLAHNYHRDLLLNRLDYLESHCGVEINVLTVHSAWHFYNDGKLTQYSNKTTERIKEVGICAESYSGKLDLEDIRFSTVADDSESFCRLFPEIVKDHGTRFIRIAELAYDDKSHGDIFRLINPTHTRTGDVIYSIRSTNSFIPSTSGGTSELMKRKTIARNFHLRLAELLDDFDEQPGRASMMTTHFGNLEPDMEIHDPYFEDMTPILELKQRHFGFDSEEPSSSRIWFSRGSVLCEYSHMIQSLPYMVSRPTQNHISIQSWIDPLLNARWPKSKYQLYGLTLYVQDNARARVDLDGGPINELVMNPPDDTGRESITVAPCGIKLPLFGMVDPKILAGRFEKPEWHQDVELEWRWRENLDVDADSGDAEITISPRGLWARIRALFSTAQDRNKRHYCIRYSPPGICPEGFQHFSYMIRRNAEDIRCGFIFETETGGNFYFGDDDLCPDIDELHAIYTISDRYRKHGGWENHVIPFYNLRWTQPVHVENAPLPSHSMISMTILVSGTKGASLVLRNISFGRPKSNANDDPWWLAKHCFGGICLKKDFEPAVKQEISLYKCDHIEQSIDESSYIGTTLTDSDGGFLFSYLTRGLYRLGNDVPDSPTPEIQSSEVYEVCRTRFDIEYFIE